MKRITIFFILIAAAVTWGHAKANPVDSLQTIFKSIDTLSFAHFEADTFHFSRDTSLLINFFSKFDTAVTYGGRNISILHIGGSHVQAGTMSHRIRQNILNAYPDHIGDRGVIFPYSAAKQCNNPIDYKVNAVEPFGLTRNVYKEIDRPLGMTGIAVYTDTCAKIKITKRDKTLAFGTDSVVILGYADCRPIEPCLVINDNGYSPDAIDTINNMFIYSSIEQITDSFTIVLDADTDNTFTLTGVILSSRKPGITFHSIGVNGASIPSYLNCTDFERDLRLIRPDMVIFGIGINDASGNNFDTLAFEENYLTLIEKFKRVNPECAFVFITNNDSYKKIGRGKYSVNRNGIAVQKVFYKLAAKTSGAVWDQFEIMGGLKSMAQWQSHRLAQRDKVHFTAAGYNLLGDLFFNAFMDAKMKIDNKTD